MALTPAEQQELDALEAELGTADKAAQADKIFGAEAVKKAEATASNIPSALRSGAQSVAQGVLMAPAELAAGATRLVSPETADKMEAGIGKFNQFMREGSNKFYGTGAQDGVSQGAADTLYGIGNTLPVGAVAGASIPAAALGGLAGGLQASGEGDTRSQAVSKGALGAALGGTVGALSNVVPYAAGKAKDIISNKLGLDEIANKKALETAAKTADEIHAAMKSEVGQIYKDLGIKKAGLKPEDYQAQVDFFAKLKGDTAKQASAQFDEVLASKQAPQEIIDAFNVVNPKTLTAAKKALDASEGTLDAFAVQDKGSLAYYNQLRKMIGEIDGDGNKGAVAEITNSFRDKLPGFAEAQDLLKQSRMVSKNIGTDLLKTIKSPKYDLIQNDIDLVMKTEKGPEVLHNMLLDGLRKDLVRNSNLTPLEQLSRTLGKDAQEQAQVIGYVSKIGNQETADKLKALTGFVNATKQAQSQPNSTIGRMVGLKSSELDPQKMASAVSSLLNGKTKFSAQFTKLMQEQTASATRTEKIFNLLRRAGKVGEKVADVGEATLGGINAIGSSVRPSAPVIPGRIIFDNPQQQQQDEGQ